MLITCPACGAPASAADRFCPACGLARITEAPAPRTIAATAAKPCPHCAAQVSAHARACPICGRGLQRAPAAIVRAVQPGRLLGRRYAVERLLSKGGMGAIYLAADRQTGQRVVVKALVDYFDAADEREAAAASQRLAQEAATLARLSHPSIPRTLGSFTDAGQVFLVMEHIAGADLDATLSRAGPDGARIAGLPFAHGDVLRWGVALCRVLEHLAAQPQPVIHHDIKPANLLANRAADTIHLVDFGTAQARLDPDGGVGLEQSSLYGTVGYAPPEQYRGRSEPRSDVYALAATLYHLASDDDPADHPFSFPRLAELGALGKALGVALDRDVQRRPHASALRERLTGLLPAYGVALLRAPDGAWLADEDALVAWCLANWDRAAAWLRKELPGQIERWWGDPELARQLTAVSDAEPDHDVALDRALALLDPSGIGREPPRLACDTPEVDFGRLPNGTLRRDLTIANIGRRHVTLWVFLPRWLGGKASLLKLAPGRRTVLSLAPDLGRVYLGGRLRGAVVVRDHYGRRANDQPVLRVPVRAVVPRSYILRRYGLPIGGAGLALAIWAGAGAMPQMEERPALAPALDVGAPAAAAIGGSDVLAQARRDLAAGSYDEARLALIRSLQDHGEDPEVRALLREVSYEEAGALFEAGNWAGARGLLQVLLADAPDDRVTQALLAETYRRPAQVAIERGDLAGAQADLEALLALPAHSDGDARQHQELIARTLERAAGAEATDEAVTAMLALRELAPDVFGAWRSDGASRALLTALAEHDRAQWGDAAPRLVHELPADPGARVALSSSGTLVALATPDRMARVYRVASGELIASYELQSLPTEVLFAPDDKLVVMTEAGSESFGRAGGWPASGNPESPGGVASDARAMVGADGIVTIESLLGQAQARLSLPGVTQIFLSADGRTLAALRPEGTLVIYRPAP